MDKESCFSVCPHHPQEEWSPYNTLGKRNGLLMPVLRASFEDALLAVVVKAREDLWLCVVLLTDRTSDILLKILQGLLPFITFSHDGC